MAQITAEMVKELRERTLAGFTDCKKAGRVAAEGLVGSYIHMGGKIGVLVEVNCETDFVARTDEFQELARNIAMHIAAEQPRYVRPEDIPAEELEREKEIYRALARKEGKPENVMDRIVEGRVKKYCSEVCLVEQPYVRDDQKTVGQLLREAIAKLGENIVIRRFVRYQLGEQS